MFLVKMLQVITSESVQSADNKETRHNSRPSSKIVRSKWKRKQEGNEKSRVFLKNY
jgi:hypothetical protein